MALDGVYMPRTVRELPPTDPLRALLALHAAAVARLAAGASPAETADAVLREVPDAVMAAPKDWLADAERLAALLAVRPTGTVH